MTERIQGPSGPPESSRPGVRGSRKVDPGKFKEEMRRVDEVSKIDPDEAKKRKRPEETLREEEAARAAPQEDRKAPSSERGAFKVPVSETHLPEEAKSAPPGKVAPETEEELSTAEPKIPLKSEGAEERLPAPLEHEEGVKTFLSEVKERSDTGGMFKTRVAEVEEGVTMPASPESSDEEKQGAAAAATREGGISGVEDKPEEPPQVEELEQEEEAGLSEEPPPPYTYLHPDILDIFERTVGAMIYMHEAGIKETTIHIQGTEEKPSIFNGASITIREYSTAPKEFNVELAGAPKAVDLFQNNMQDLRTAFDSVPAKFKVKNIETSYQ